MACQTFGYFCIGFIFAGLGIFIGIFIITAVVDFIILIIKCLCCQCDDEDYTKFGGSHYLAGFAFYIFMSIFGGEPID